MVRYNPITGEEMPSHQTHADHLQRGEVVVECDEEVPASGSTLSSDVSDDEKQESKSTSHTIAFEDMVAAEMERLRLDYGQEDGAVKAKKGDAAAAAEVPAASTIAPSVGSNHHRHHHHHHQQQQQLQRKQVASSQSSTTSPPHNSRCISTSLLGRDEGQELATRRQRAREYGEQLRLQMEQDRLTKMSRARTHDAPRNVDVDGTSPASAYISTAKATDAAASSAASYGELLRLQMKEDEERRRKQRGDNRSGSVAEASIDAIGNFTDSIASSKKQKAVEYRRQLDEQIAAKSSSHRASKSSGTDCKEAVDGQLEYKSNQAATNDRKKKDEYALQLREQMDAKAAQRQCSYSIQAPESSSNASSVLFPWHLGEEREAQERQRRRDAALEQQQLLELQIQEQNEAKALMKKEEEDNEARDAGLFKSRHSALPSHATDEVAIAPIEEPRRPSNTSDDCPLLAAESTFIPTPKPEIRKKADEYTAVCQSDVPICPMKSPVIRRGRGGEAFTVSLDASEGANSGVTSMPPPTIPSCASGVPTNLKATKYSPCRRSRSKSKSATASPVRLPPMEPPVSPSEEIKYTVVDEDDVLVQDILRSALRRIEDNVPINDEGSQEMHSLGPPKKKSLSNFALRKHLLSINLMEFRVCPTRREMHTSPMGAVIMPTLLKTPFK